MCADNDESYKYAFMQLYKFQTYPINFTLIRQHPTSISQWHYNLYCNALMDLVQDGYYFFLDDDDWLYHDRALEEMSRHFKYNDTVICQMLRHGKPKPSDSKMNAMVIENGYIGMPCAIVHHSVKARMGDEVDADFHWIKSIVALSPNARFVKQAVVVTSPRGHGKGEN